MVKPPATEGITNDADILEFGVCDFRAHIVDARGRREIDNCLIHVRKHALDPLLAQGALPPTEEWEINPIAPQNYRIRVLVRSDYLPLILETMKSVQDALYGSILVNGEEPCTNMTV